MSTVDSSCVESFDQVNDSDVDTTQRTSDGTSIFSGIGTQFVVIVVAFLAYMGVRAIANGSESAAHAHAHDLLAFERAIGLDIEHSIQQFALDRPKVVSFFNWVYAWTYWPMIIGAFVATWFLRPQLFRIYRNAMLISGAMGLAIFAAYPVAPPRFLDGFVDTVDAEQRGHFIAHPSFLINKFAALPSFHVGWVALASVVLAATFSRSWIRIVFVIPPALMTIAVVVTGNHYLVDAILGIAIAALGLVIARRRSSAEQDADVGGTVQTNDWIDPLVAADTSSQNLPRRV